jgi:hypothetical protein
MPRGATTFLVFLLLVAYGASSRLVSEVPNFHAVAAAALLAGYYFRRAAVAVCVPLVSMALTDLVIGFHHPLVMASVYACLVLPVAARPLLRARCSLLRAGTCALAASAVFFLVTNLAHWYALLPHTATSLERCFLAALPFFRYTLTGDLAYTLALFGALALGRALTAAAARVAQPRARSRRAAAARIAAR